MNFTIKRLNAAAKLFPVIIIVIFFIKPEIISAKEISAKILTLTSNNTRMALDKGSNDGIEIGNEVIMINPRREKVCKARIIKTDEKNSFADIYEHIDKLLTIGTSKDGFSARIIISMKNEKIKADDEYTKRLAEAKKKERQYLSGLEETYRKVKEFDELSTIEKTEKINLWQKFLNDYKKNNNYAGYAEERIKYWQNYREEASVSAPAVNISQQTAVSQQPEKIKIYDIGNGIKLEMILIPAGSFMMGSPASESGRYDNEQQHQVTLTKDFYIGKYEVTQEQWESVMGNNPSYFKNAGKTAPVEQVSWNDCQEYIRKLKEKTGKQFRLPTEAEWEYACRAGSQTAIYTGGLTIKSYYNGPELDAIAWYGGNSEVSYSGGYDASGWKDKQYSFKYAGTHPVGQKQANAFGLYDMLGNVWEWCEDWYKEYPSSSVTDPIGANSGSGRVLRGGGWLNYAQDCRSAYRSFNDPSSGWDSDGVRLVLPIGQ